MSQIMLTTAPKTAEDSFAPSATRPTSVNYFSFNRLRLGRGKRRRLLHFSPPNQPQPNSMRRCLHSRTVGLPPRHARFHRLQNFLRENFSWVFRIPLLPAPTRHDCHPCAPPP